MRRWLARRFTGCAFAQALAVQDILFGAFDERAEPSDVDAIFDLAADQHLAAMIVFPTVRSEVALLAQLDHLATGDRWRLARESVGGLDTDDLLVGIEWRTSSGLSATPMGFGPFPTMPVTRRAPYVCIATWPGGHENPYWQRYAPTKVDFLDARLDPSEWPRPKYKKAWDASRLHTSALLAESADDAGWYRTVAFRLANSPWAPPAAP